MQFTGFNLMPWPHLPEDFREQHRSVWVDIPSDLYDPLDPEQPEAVAEVIVKFLKDG